MKMWLTWSLICTEQRPLKGSVGDWFQVNKKDKKYFFTPLPPNYWSLTAQTVVWIQRALAGSVNGHCLRGIRGLGWQWADPGFICSGCWEIVREMHLTIGPGHKASIHTHSLRHGWGQTSLLCPTGRFLRADALTPLLTFVPLQLIWKLEVCHLYLNSSAMSKRVCTLVALTAYHRMMEWSGLASTLKIIWFQLFCHG